MRWSVDSIISDECLILSERLRGCVYGLDMTEISAYPNILQPDMSTTFLMKTGEKIQKLLKGNLIFETRQEKEIQDDEWVIYGITETGTLYTIRNVSYEKFKILSYLKDVIQDRSEKGSITCLVPKSYSYDLKNSINITDLSEFLNLDQQTQQGLYEKFVADHSNLAFFKHQFNDPSDVAAVIL